MTCDTSDINAIDTREVHLSEGFSIDAGIGDDNTLRHHRLILLLPVDLDDRANECHDGLPVSLSSDDAQLVANMEDSISIGNADMSLLKDTVRRSTYRV